MSDSIPARLRAHGTSSTTQSRTAYGIKEGNGWTTFTFKEYYEETLTVARAFLSIGLDKDSKISILAFNRPEWVISDVACMMIGGVPAGIYQTCSPEEVAYIIQHSESEIVVVENKEQWEKVNVNRDSLPSLKKIVVMRGTEIDDPDTLSWESLLKLGAESPESEVLKRIDSIEPSDPATFIYTSGTTGPPKAVMLSHDNLVFTTDAAVSLVELTEEDCLISYLPLSHIAEQMFSIHAPITAAGTIYFAESIDKLKDNLGDVRPTILFGVPRIWEKFHAGLNQKLSEATGFKKLLVGHGQKVGRAANHLKNQGIEPSGLLNMQYNFFRKKVYGKVKEALGLDRARICVSGAAPISKEVLDFMSGLDIVIHEVYGQSEDCGPTTFNKPGQTKFGTVGPMFPGVEVKIADDGEILVKGRNVFLGYYKNQEATDETIQDGWLYSGDLGSFDPDGFLSITGRKKEIIITAGGKNITPKNIESALRDLPLISQAVVIGDRRKFLSALLTLDADYAAIWAQENGISSTDLHSNQTLIDALTKQVNDSVNSKFAKVEHVRKFTVLPRDLTIDDGELTPTLKVKRRIVNANWEAEIEAMYQS